MENLMFNFVAVVLPALLLQVLWQGKPPVTSPARKKAVVFTVALLSQGACLLFTLHFAAGLPVSLEEVPLILGALYGGYFVGGGLVVADLALRFLLFGHVMPGMFAVHTAIVLVTFACMVPFIRANRQHKVCITVLLALLDATLISLVSLLHTADLRDAVVFLAVFSVMNGFAMLVTVSLAEAIRERELLVQSVIQAEKYQVVADLAASVAHEIRNPLTTIRGFVQLMLQSELTAEQRQRYLEVTLGEVDRTLKVARDYMDLAKQNLCQEETFDVSEVIASTITVLTPFAHLAGVELQADYAAPAHYVEGDRTRLEQVLVNIVKNGIEASQSGGRVELTTSLDRPRKLLRIAVKDNGVGMSAQQLLKVGHPFYSTKSSGTGLGLTTSQRLVQAMKGAIHIQSAAGAGTTVTISLPARASAEEPAAHLAPSLQREVSK